MKMNKIFAVLCSCLLAAMAFAQNDSVISRDVNVEREFQPTIKSAGKINIKPDVYTPEFTPAEAEYSDFSQPLATDFNMSTLGYAETNFTRPVPTNGFLRGAVGHVMSQADFHYYMTERRNTQFDIHMNHLAQWGVKTLSNTNLGFNFDKKFRKTDMFFDVEGGNIFYTRYGRYYDASTNSYTKKFLEMTPADRQTIWMAQANLGFCSLPSDQFTYLAQTGYKAFILPAFGVEHQVRTKGLFDWTNNVHHAGADVYVQNNFYTLESGTQNSKHFIHLEPYYGYTGKRVRLHAGVNFDIELGNGSKVFFPSPNVLFEADLTRDWLTLFADATGSHAFCSIEEHLTENRYLAVGNDLLHSHPAEYTPIDATLGFKIRPHADLLMDIHAGYALFLHSHVWNASSSDLGVYEFGETNRQRWKVGAKLNFHYQDIVNIALSGDYFISSVDSIDFDGTVVYMTGADGKNLVYDCPAWEIKCRIDAKIDSKWSLYSDNYFMGKRHALVDRNTTKELRPVIDLNLGVQYNINRWLACYLQLNNYLGFGKLKYDVFYGYQAMGINFLAGVTWAF